MDSDLVCGDVPEKWL